MATPRSEKSPIATNSAAADAGSNVRASAWTDTFAGPAKPPSSRTRAYTVMIWYDGPSGPARNLEVASQT
ncbi:hypothetical protein DIPPA_17229 [Diplonema papillatum]|nr:hypothetical protein DIPPA_17229 [Diplonema papillatum]